MTALGVETVAQPWFGPLPDADAAGYGEPANPALDAIVSRVIVGEAIEHVPPPAWIVNGLFEANSLAVVAGRPKCGKSFLMLDLALSVATGRDWHGHSVEPGAVLFVAAEGHSGVGPRVTAWKSHHGVAEAAGVLWHPGPINLLNHESVAAVVEYAWEACVGLVVFDTLNRCMVGGDENSSRDMGQVVDSLERIRTATRACVVAVHHVTKGGGQVRGHGALEGALTTLVEVSDDESVTVVKNSAQKNAAEHEPMRFRMQPVGGSLVPVLGGSGRTERMTEKAVTAIRALAAVELDGGVSSTVWKAAAELSDSSFYRARKLLVTGGYVGNSGSESRARYFVTEQGRKVLG